MKTKQLIMSISPVIALCLSSAGVFASDDFAEGDLLVGFYEITGSGPSAVVGPDTLVLNLGPANLYRENTQNNVAVGTINSALTSSNINTDLTNAFGSDWANDATASVYWFVIGGVTQAGSLTNGDPIRTTYYSKARTNLTTSSSGPGTNVPAVLGQFETPSLSLGLSGFSSGTNGAINGVNGGTATSGVNTAMAVIPVGNINTMDEFLPPTTLDYFGIGENPRQRMTTGVIAGGTLVEGALNVFRYLDTTSGADLTSGASSGNAVAGTPQFIGTLTLAANGDLKITAIPSLGTFSTWANTNNVTGGATGDSDNDGIDNLVEYALNLNPAASDGAPGTFNGSTVSFSKRAEAVTNGDVTYAIEESDDLGVTDAWQPVTPTTNTSSAITYQLPAGSPKKFARLVVKTTP